MSGLLKVLGKILTLFAKNATYSQVEKPKNKTEETTISNEIKFKNDSQRLKDEYGLLYEKNRDLQDILIEIAQFCRIKYNKEITVTMIYRTQEEQDSIYKDDPKYKEKKFTSPHQYYHAFDLRSSTFSATEIKEIEDMINNSFNKTNYYKWTARNHNVGLGDHFHVQFVRK